MNSKHKKSSKSSACAVQIYRKYSTESMGGMFLMRGDGCDDILKI